MLATQHKNKFILPISLVEFRKNAQKTTQFDKNKALFFPNHDIKAAVNPQMWYNLLWCGVCP